MKTYLLRKVSVVTVPTIIGFIAGGAILATAYAYDGGDGKQQVHLSDEQKQVLEQVRELRQDGHIDEAQSLAQEAGLPFGPRFGMRMGHLTDEQKSAREQIQALRESGDSEGAKALAEEVGLPVPFEGRGQDNEDIRTAIEQKDYSTWKQLTQDAPFADKVNEDFFNHLVQAHEYRQAGNHEAARAIMEELGMSKFHRGDAPPQR